MTICAANYSHTPEQRTAKCWGYVALIFGVLGCLAFTSVQYVVGVGSFFQVVAALIVLMCSPQRPGKGKGVYMSAGCLAWLLAALHLAGIGVAAWVASLEGTLSDGKGVDLHAVHRAIGLHGIRSFGIVACALSAINAGVDIVFGIKCCAAASAVAEGTEMKIVPAV